MLMRVFINLANIKDLMSDKVEANISKQHWTKNERVLAKICDPCMLTATSFASSATATLSAVQRICSAQVPLEQGLVLGRSNVCI